MYPKQIIILVVKFVILAPNITSGFEIISTTTEKHNSRCQQDVISTLTNNLQEQQNFWINLYNNTYTRKEIVQLFDKKMEEMEAKFASKQEEMMKRFDEKLEKIASSLGKVEDGKTTLTLPKNCLEVLRRGNTNSGVYTIQPQSDKPSFEVRCEMDIRGGGWTYVLNRFDGSQEFYLDWQNYKIGFGNLSAEFWLGLQHLYEITGSEDNHLLVEVVDWNNNYFYAMYNTFKIGNEKEGYPIKILDGYSGDAGDSLKIHKKMKFSTHDRDQDTWANNCAVEYHGSWWFQSCHHSNLAGTYFNTAKADPKGMVWYHATSAHVSLKKAKMMVRPYYLCY